jgi:hypothetical protein
MAAPAFSGIEGPDFGDGFLYSLSRPYWWRGPGHESSKETGWGAPDAQMGMSLAPPGGLGRGPAISFDADRSNRRRVAPEV